ncbi:MAG: phage tail protein [Pseudomonadota bacterium]
MSPPSRVLRARIDQASLDEALRLLHGMDPLVRRVAVRAIKKTLRTVGAAASREIVKTLNIRVGEVKKTFSYVLPRLGDISAAFVVSGKSVPLAAYSVRKGKKGLTVQVKKRSGRKLIKHAFLATMPVYGKGGVVVQAGAAGRGSGGGHVGIFWRTDQGGKRSPRLPIKELYGPSVADVFSNTETLTPVMEKTGGILEKNFAHELQFEVKKLS